jgi:transcriptional regulator with XRE-family HTH domain
MDASFPGVHPVNMTTRQAGPGHFLREWRERKGLTLEQVVEKIELFGAERATPDDPLSTPIKMTHASLSRIERGLQPYNQRLLELLSEIYDAPEGVLINVRPGPQDVMWSIWEKLPPVERTRLIEIAKVMGRTGTDD